jgi:hypothetical protein
MLKKCVFLFLLLPLTGLITYGQSVIFLHHSTGGNLFTEGNVADWFANYNSTNGTNYQITDREFPGAPYPWENYPYDYWNLWVNNQCSSTNLNIQCLGNLVQNYDVVIFKHCFPGAEILAPNGSPSVSSPIKTLANYQLQYRALRTLMDQYPQKKFIIWTLVPLHRLATTSEQAARAKQFVDWVKTSWLTEDGQAHSNIHIFDFFGLAAELNPTPVNGQVNCLKYIYEGSHSSSDSHPNTLANQTIGPVFAQFIVNTIKNQQTGTESVNLGKSFIKIHPNPSFDIINIDISELKGQATQLDIFNMQGKHILQRPIYEESQIIINTSQFPSGSYLINIKTSTSHLSNTISVIHP